VQSGPLPYPDTLHNFLCLYTRKGRTALMLCARVASDSIRGHAQGEGGGCAFAALLLRHGAAVNAVDFQGNSALHHAYAFTMTVGGDGRGGGGGSKGGGGSGALLSLLLAAGADPTRTNGQGLVPSAVLGLGVALDHDDDDNGGDGDDNGNRGPVVSRIRDDGHDGGRSSHDHGHGGGFKARQVGGRGAGETGSGVRAASGSDEREYDDGYYSE